MADSDGATGQDEGNMRKKEDEEAEELKAPKRRRTEKRAVFSRQRKVEQGWRRGSKNASDRDGFRID